MNSRTSDTMKTIGCVMATGGAIMLGAGMLKGNSTKKAAKKKIKKTADIAMNTVDGILSGMQNFMK